MPGAPKVFAFDVIETLFSLEPMRPKIRSLGLESSALELWFARTLRDGFALAAVGGFKTFRQVAGGALEILLDGIDHLSSPATTNQFLDAMINLKPQPDAGFALAKLRDRRIPVFLVTNGSTEFTQKLVARAGFDEYVRGIVSIDDVKQWKPRPEVYLHAALVAGVEPAQVALVSAHSWDVQGAKRAGLSAGWVRRGEKSFHPAMDFPDASGDALTHVCDQLLALGSK
jgi:2-haloacid dehalogenase